MTEHEPGRTPRTVDAEAPDLELRPRFDYLNSSVPAQHLDAGRFVPARDFAAVPNLPNWKDINPRFSAAYDLFGKGTTAVKFSAGRYVLGEFVGTARNNNPVQTSVNSATRTWTDNGDFIRIVTSRTCRLITSAVHSNVTSAPNITTTRAGCSTGGASGVSVQTSLTAEHQLSSQIALNGGYFRPVWQLHSHAQPRRHFRQLRSTASPRRSTRLPGGGGNQVRSVRRQPLEVRTGAQPDRLREQAWPHVPGLQRLRLCLLIKLLQGAFVQIGATPVGPGWPTPTRRLAVSTVSSSIRRRKNSIEVNQAFQTQVKIVHLAGIGPDQRIWQNLPVFHCGRLHGVQCHCGARSTVTPQQAQARTCRFS